MTVPPSPLGPGAHPDAPAAAGAPRPVPARSADTTRENPWPLRRLVESLSGYIDRTPFTWVEGQVVEWTPRPGTRMAFFTLRDTDADCSMSVTARPEAIHALGGAFDEGARVVVHVKPNFYERRGTLSLRADEIHLQGLGELLARIEEVRSRLAAEGLFAAERKVPLPLIPRTVGLVCGRNAKAKDDVIVNASARWPAVRFEIREVNVQGDHAVTDVCRAMAELDALPHVDVIVVARGGGAVEDLLPFSDETLVRTAAAVRTPLVSAIGHEGDSPLLDLVADFRASTPTDAARRIVPDAVQERAGLDHALTQARAAFMRRLSRERDALALLVQRPVLTDPARVVDAHVEALTRTRDQLRRGLEQRLHAEGQALTRAAATLTALSPQATLDRGYAILRTPSGEIVRSHTQASKGTLLEGILAEGRMVAQVVGSTPGTAGAPPGGGR